LEPLDVQNHGLGKKRFRVKFIRPCLDTKYFWSVR